MNALFLFFRGFCYYILGALDLCMLVRAVLSWVPEAGELKIARFCYYVTEPLISPVRALLHRLFPSSAYSPLDLSFFVTMLLILALQSLVA